MPKAEKVGFEKRVIHFLASNPLEQQELLQFLQPALHCVDWSIFAVERPEGKPAIGSEVEIADIADS